VVQETPTGPGRMMEHTFSFCLVSVGRLTALGDMMELVSIVSKRKQVREAGMSSITDTLVSATKFAASNGTYKQRIRN